MIQGKTYTLHIGNNLDILPTLPDNSVDSIVTDPPYELGFMGKKWDSSGIAYSVELWTQCLRVLKPGGHLLSFGGTRTWHRVAVAIEDAGFEVRDSIAWMYGSGFPKSLDVSKAIDKSDATEARRKRDLQFVEWMRTTGLSPSKCDEILKANKLISQTSSRAIHYFNEGQPQVATSEFFDALRPYLPEVPDYIEKMVAERTIESQNFKNREVIATRTFVRNTESWESSGGMLAVGEKEIKETAPATPEAKQWEGWGTALKPAFEPIVVARKPLIGTVAENVLTHGTGGLNIDGSRIGTEQITINNYPVGFDPKGNLNGLTQIGQDYESKTSEGRWPANVILDEYTAELLDEQTGDLKPATSRTARDKHIPMPNNPQLGDLVTHPVYGDTGGASRFFYVAKASKRDRNEGLEDSNTHPTVKPTDLMRYLIKLVTPPGGTVLDPFTGSGSTGKAAILEGFTFIGCELTEEYIPIIQGRLEHAEEQARLAEEKKDEALF